MSYTNGNSAGDRHLEPPPTYEALQAANTSLKTRVSELEVINDLYQSRVSQLEQEATVRRSGESIESAGKSVSSPESHQLRSALEETQYRERELKRRLDDLEREVVELQRESPSGCHRSKKMRVSDIVHDGLVISASTSTTTPSPPTAAPVMVTPSPTSNIAIKSVQ